jgi:hypothetical protein
MVWPAIKLHQLYSLNIADGLDIILEDLDTIDFTVLKNIVSTKELGKISLGPHLYIDTYSKSISIVGNKINNSTYIINRGGDIIILTYNFSNQNILTMIEYLYHIKNNIIIDK